VSQGSISYYKIHLLHNSFQKVNRRTLQPLQPQSKHDPGGYGGHPPIPLARKTIFHLGSFSTVFRVPNFWGRFEALNDVFWGFGAQVIA
jgi:hypothetical protein